MRNRHKKYPNCLEILLKPEVMDAFATARAAWYEGEKEVQDGLAWGKEKARLLRWVRRQMTRRLTPCERRCVELCFFQGLTFREAAAHTRTNPSSVYRGVRRALRKLNAAATIQPPRRSKERLEALGHQTETPVDRTI